MNNINSVIKINTLKLAIIKISNVNSGKVFKWIILWFILNFFRGQNNIIYFKDLISQTLKVFKQIDENKQLFGEKAISIPI